MEDPIVAVDAQQVIEGVGQKLNLWTRPYVS